MNDANSLINVLPNLGIGVVAIVVLGGALYIFVLYLKARDVQMVETHAKHMEQIDAMSRSHLKQLDEREEHTRNLERDFRVLITEQLSKNTIAMGQSSETILKATSAMDRILSRVDGLSSRRMR